MARFYKENDPQYYEFIRVPIFLRILHGFITKANRHGRLISALLADDRMGMVYVGSHGHDAP